MMECVIHGAAVSDWDGLYDQFKSQLALPDWFGRNLDALYDCLTGLSNAEITIYQWDTLAGTLGKKSALLQKVLTDAGLANPGLVVCLLNGDTDEI